MRSYQSVLILKPDYDEPKLDEAVEKVNEFIKSNGGACLKLDKWGKKRLAYKIKKNRFGVYLNIYHTCDNDKVPSLEKKYRLYDPIIKYLIVRLSDKELERAMGQEDNGAKKEEDKEKTPESPTKK